MFEVYTAERILLGSEVESRQLSRVPEMGVGEMSGAIWREDRSCRWMGEVFYNLHNGNYWSVLTYTVLLTTQTYRSKTTKTIYIL